MPLYRRDFMKLFGVSVASLVLNRGCIPFTPTPTCYAPTPPRSMQAAASARERLRQYWLGFPDLAQKSQEDDENNSRVPRTHSATPSRWMLLAA